MLTRATQARFKYKTYKRNKSFVCLKNMDSSILYESCYKGKIIYEYDKKGFFQARKEFFLFDTSMRVCLQERIFPLISKKK